MHSMLILTWQAWSHYQHGSGLSVSSAVGLNWVEPENAATTLSSADTLDIEAICMFPLRVNVYYGRLCSIYCSHDIWELCCQERVNFDFVCRLWETNVLLLSPCRCLKYPRQHESEHDISAVCATVCWKDPEATRWRVSKFGHVTSLWFWIEPELHDLATYFPPHYLSKIR